MANCFTRMKCLLGFLLAVGISVTLSNADCFFEINKSAEGCVQDGKLYAFGSAWMKDCYRCHCDQEGIQCCAIAGRPVDFDEKNCELIFDKESCSYSVVQKGDPSKTCPFSGMVG